MCFSKVSSVSWCSVITDSSLSTINLLHNMLVELALSLFGLILILLAFSNRLPSNLPPGPRRYPILGSKKLLTTLKSHEELRDKYGDIVWTRIGAVDTITIFNYRIAKEAFSKTEVSHRPDWEAFQFLADGDTGLFFSNGEQWSRARRFFLKNLRDLGMGKSRLSDAILSEARALVDDFKNHTDTPTGLPSSISLAVLNVLWQLVADQRYDLNDEKIVKFMSLNKEYQKNLRYLAIPDIFPWTKYLPSRIRRKLFKSDWREMSAVKSRALMKEVIDEHKKNLDPEKPRDIIDAYLIEMEKRANSGSFFSENALIRDLLDLFAAGFDTTSTALRWLCLYVAAYPKVQKKIQDEIDEVVGSDALPSLVHRPRLVYLEATLLEVLRLCPAVPVGVPHATNSDIVLEGYMIPKGFLVNACIGAIHTDPRYWKRPREFYPDRFIDEAGNTDVPKEGFFPFGVGKRSCLGESLARMELYFFGAALLQNFSFAPPEGRHIDLGCLDIPVQLFPKPQDIVITARN